MKQVKDIGESVARLPETCVNDLTGQQIREHKESALHDALMDLKSADKGRSDLVAQIEDLEQRQKRAYLRLFENVSGEIGKPLYKSMEQREAEIREEQLQDETLKAAELEYNRIREQGNVAAPKTSLDDLFLKYNI